MERIGMTKNELDQRADKLGEHWDLLNKRREIIGQKKRGQAFSAGEWHLVVNATIFNFKHEILLQQRSFNKIGRPGEWDLETGGSALAGETSLDAIRREVKEEINLQYDFKTENFVESFRNWPVFDDWYAIKVDLPLASFQIQKSEIEQIRYVPIGELTQYISDDNLPYVKKAESVIFGGNNA